MAKELVEVNGRQVRMSEAAFAIASKHFGASRKRVISKGTPIELRKTAPKLDIEPAQISPPIKAQVDMGANTAVPGQAPEAKIITRRKPGKK